MRKLLLSILVVAVLTTPAAWAWRAPTFNEKYQIVNALPRFYHQACIRYSIRISSVDNHFGAVFFRFVRPTARGAIPSTGRCS